MMAPNECDAIMRLNFPGSCGRRYSVQGLLKLFLLQDKRLKNALCATNERLKGSSFTFAPQWTDANRVFYIITKQWKQN